jgi:uncharacterized protein YdiU (UPF0061 family)
MQAEMVPLLADYVIKHHYPHLQDKEDKYAQLLTEVSRRTGRLFALWQSLGFVHGVLNTDNMSILGETIDYGPFGFLEAFDPEYTPNTTDEMGRRYTFGQQPEIGQQNLAHLANAMIVGGLMDEEAAKNAVRQYAEVMLGEYNALMARKLGMKEYEREVTVGVLTLMYEHPADFTNTFRALLDVSTSDPEDSIPDSLRAAIPEELTGEKEEAWKAWLKQYRQVLKTQQEGGQTEEERRAMQAAVSPVYIPRNHLLQEVILEAEKGNVAAVQDYLEILKKPYEEQPGKEHWRKASPGVIRRGIEMLSCSS